MQKMKEGSTSSETEKEIVGTAGASNLGAPAPTARERKREEVNFG
jgi:hypothetical protein